MLKMQKLDQKLELMIKIFLFIFVVFMPFKIALTQSSLGLAFLCWVLRIWLTKGVRLHKVKLEWAFGLFVLANLVSFPFSQNVPETFTFLKRLLLIPIVYLVTSQVNTKMFKVILITFVLSLSLYSLLGVFSYILSPGQRVNYVQHWQTTGGITMIASLATFTFVVLEKKVVMQLVWGLSTIINVTCLILTATRGSWLGFFAGALLIVWLKNRKFIFVLIALVPIIYFFAPNAYSDRIHGIFDPNYGTNKFRLVAWGIGLEIFKDYPLVGVGDMGMAKVVQEYASPSSLDILGGLGHFHSNYVHIAVSLGIIGFLAFMFLMCSVLYRLFREKKKKALKGKKYQYIWGLAAVAIFIAFCVNGLFEWNYGDAEIATMIWFTIGLALVDPAKNDQSLNTETYE